MIVMLRYFLAMALAILGSVLQAQQNTSALRIPVQKPKTRELDTQMARRYLKEARTFWEQGRIDETHKLLELTKEYRGESISDYWYLMAMSEKPKNNHLDWLLQAFEADQWLDITPLSAALELVKNLYNRHMYRDIIAWAGRWKPKITNHKDIQFYLAMSFHNIGKKQEAKELALRNLGRYDNEARYFRILLDIPDEAMWSQFYFYLANYPLDSPHLLRYLMGKSRNHKERLLSLYINLFGDDYFSTAQRILLRKDNLLSRSQIFFKNYPTTDFLVLSQVLHKLSSNQSTEELLQILNGHYTIDRDYNGKPEEKIIFADGQLLERYISNSHDDIAIRWNRYGEPDRYQSFSNWNGNGQTVDIFYDRYPFVREMTIFDYKSRRTYLFSPGRLAYPLLKPANTVKQP